jgi:hypothetical protein
VWQLEQLADYARVALATMRRSGSFAMLLLPIRT